MFLIAFALSACSSTTATELEEEIEKNEKLTEEMTALEDTHAELLKKFEEKETHLSALTEEVSELEEALEELPEENEELSEEVKTLKETNETLSDKNKELEKKLKEKEATAKEK